MKSISVDSGYKVEDTMVPTYHRVQSLIHTRLHTTDDLDIYMSLGLGGKQKHRESMQTLNTERML